MRVYLPVCPLKTRERVGRLSPNFQGNSRVPQDGLRYKNWEDMGMGARDFTLFVSRCTCVGLLGNWAYWEALAYSLGQH